jgi:oligopeptide transport system substrate-binding protein
MSMLRIPRLLGVTLLVLTLASALPLLVGPATSAQDAGGKVLRIPWGSFPLTLDPQASGTLDEIGVVGLNYEGLTRLDAHLDTVPGAAESWELDAAGTALTFHLRAGLTYADGSPLTAQRFADAVARACDPATAAPYATILFDVVGCEDRYTAPPAAAATPGASPVAEAAATELGVRARDDRTLEIRLTHAAPYFPTVASTWVFYPVKRELVAQGGAEWWKDAALQVGNGPFRITAIDAEAPDQQVTYAANERYWGGRPTLDGIAYTYVTGETAGDEIFAAYRAGEFDIAGFPLRELPTVEADPQLGQQLLRYPSASTTHLSLNLNREPFQDKQVRAAFSYAFDRAAYCRDVAHGACSPTLTWIPEGVPGHVASDAYGFDPEKARAALADSSYGGPDGLPAVTYYYGSDFGPEAKETADWLAARYKEVLGIELELVPIPGEELNAMFAGADTWPQFAFWGWTQDYPDPQNWLSLYWTCGSSVYAGFVGYCNPAFDDLVAKADAELDPTRRQDLYAQAQRLLIEDVPGPFLFNAVNVVLVSPRLTGYATTPVDIWPGWLTPLTLDLAPATATPSASPAA